MMSYQITSKNIKTSKKYRICRKTVSFKLNPVPCSVENPELWVKSVMKKIFNHIMHNTDCNDKLGFTFSSGLFSKGDAYIPFKQAKDIRFCEIWELLGRIYQSNSEGFHTETFSVTVTQAQCLGNGKADTVADTNATDNCDNN